MSEERRYRLEDSVSPGHGCELLCSAGTCGCPSCGCLECEARRRRAETGVLFRMVDAGRREPVQLTFDLQGAPEGRSWYRDALASPAGPTITTVARRPREEQDG